MKSAKAIHASTQKFTEIVDIGDSIVVLEGGYACLIIEVTGSNFALLSQREQEAKIVSYASLLNAVTFPIQILIRNKRVDITSYLKELEEHERTTKNDLLATHIKLYRTFVHEMIRVNVVLSKQFYLVIPYNSLEAGVSGATQAGNKGAGTSKDFMATATKALTTKAESLLPQIQKLSVSAKVLQKEELIKLFYEIYNSNESVGATMIGQDLQTPIIRRQQ
jgi:hypothetical protein